MCYFSQAQQEDWAKANKTCASYGGRLVTPRTEDLHDFVVELMEKLSWEHAWIGAYENESEWRWEKDGKLLGRFLYSML